MKIRRAYKYRIYPNKQQQQALAVQFGHARFIFNYGLGARKQAFKETGKDLSYTATALLRPKLKQDLPWLKEADSQVLQ
nr:helix-turn-helix domain-containing protein [uncultured Desulfobacter sp.]